MSNFRLAADPITGQQCIRTALSGKALLTIPQLNKSTAFSEEERKAFGLHGKLPLQIESLAEQVQRCYLQFKQYNNPYHQNLFLHSLHDNNQTLFYKLVETHLTEMMPIIYTPTVGTTVANYHLHFRQPRGLYIAYPDRNDIREILRNRTHPDVDLIVVSDGEGVLGMGDQGIGGMHIPVAKLMVYSACGNLDPLRTLPIFLDVGTNNKKLMNDPLYLGWRHPRVHGEAYREFIRLFLEALKDEFPQIFLHWEDFGRANAFANLILSQDGMCAFNDDIQGTGVVTLAAVLGACKLNETPLTEQRIVIFGAGSAGTGIAEQLADAMVREGLSLSQAQSRFWLVDRHGLICHDMPNLTPTQRPFARNRDDDGCWPALHKDDISLLDVIKQAKPTVLIGCSAQSGAFDRKVITTMAKHVERPAIMPLSNPTHKAEAIPEDLLNWTDGKALIATGSPFLPVDFRGDLIESGQCNNALAFPGIGLGVLAVQATKLTTNMLYAASQAICDYTLNHFATPSNLLPNIAHATRLARHVAIAVGKQAINDRVSTYTLSEVVQAIDKNRWRPHYLPLVREGGP